MSYTDIGYNHFFQKQQSQSESLPSEISPFDFQSQFAGLQLNKLLGVWESERLKFDFDKGEIVLKDLTNMPRVILGSGALKVSKNGINVLGAQNHELIFSSDFSIVKEVQLQIIPTQRSTNSPPYEALNDARISIDFSDWVDFNMYFELVWKAGSPAGSKSSARLFSVTDNIPVPGSNMTTTVQGTPQQTRVGPIEKSDSGIKVYRVEYGHNPYGGGSDFVDIYIGRIIMRSKLFSS